MIKEFERHLRGSNLSENTISSYLFAVKQYQEQIIGEVRNTHNIWILQQIWLMIQNIKK